MEVKEFAELRCDWCRISAPHRGSGHDRTGGWVAGWIHTDPEDGFAVRCAAQLEWEKIYEISNN